VWQLAEQLKPPPAPLAVLLASLWIQGQVIGSLEVVWEEGYSITTQEEQFLEAVAVQVALAITNARLYQEKERAPQEAREQVKAIAGKEVPLSVGSRRADEDIPLGQFWMAFQSTLDRTHGLLAHRNAALIHFVTQLRDGCASFPGHTLGPCQHRVDVTHERPSPRQF